MNANTKKILGVSAVALALYFLFKPKKKVSGAEERSTEGGGGGGGSFAAVPIMPVVPYTAGTPVSQVPVHITITPTGQTATSGTSMVSQAGATTPSLNMGTTTPSQTTTTTPVVSGTTNQTTSGSSTTVMNADGGMYEGGESWGI